MNDYHRNNSCKQTRFSTIVIMIGNSSPINNKQASTAGSVHFLSQLSISQRPSNQHQEITKQSSSIDDCLSDVRKINLELYRCSKYWKIPRKPFLCSLRLQLDLQLKRKKLQRSMFFVGYTCGMNASVSVIYDNCISLISIRSHLINFGL